MHVFGQVREIDSLSKILPTLRDTSRIDCMNAMSSFYTDLNKRDSAEYFQQISLYESQKTGYIHGIAEATSNAAGIALYFDNDFKETERQCRIAYYWFDKTGNKTNMRDYTGFFFLNSLFWQSKFDEMLKVVNQFYEEAKAQKYTIEMQGAMQAKSDIF